MKMSEYVKVLDSEEQREHFTRHGLHVNTVGKELMAQTITDHIRKPLIERKTPPIILKWRQAVTDSGQEGTEAQEKVTYPRTSGRTATINVPSSRSKEEIFDIAPELEVCREYNEEEGAAKETPGSPTSITSGQYKRTDEEDARHVVPKMDIAYSLREEGIKTMRQM